MAKVDFESGDAGLYEGIWDGPGPWAASVTTSEKPGRCVHWNKLAIRSLVKRQRHEVEQHTWDKEFKPGFRSQQLRSSMLSRASPLGGDIDRGFGNDEVDQLYFWTMTDIFGLITARGGSKSVPRKNILPLAGKPLIACQSRPL